MQELIQEEELNTNVPVCNSNLTTPVEDYARYIEEIKTTIGNITYVDNAD